MLPLLGTGNCYWLVAFYTLTNKVVFPLGIKCICKNEIHKVKEQAQAESTIGHQTFSDCFPWLSEHISTQSVKLQSICIILTKNIAKLKVSVVGMADQA